jgi:hypothetical protein
MELEIKGRTVIDFDVLIDNDLIYSYRELDVFFTYFPTYFTLEVLINSHLVIDIGVIKVRDNPKMFGYLIKEGILGDRGSPYEFNVLSEKRLSATYKEIRKVYIDLFDNYKAYERDFIIDTLV